MAVDADGSPIFMPVNILRQMSGESIEPEECRAVLGKKTFEVVYGLYIEWHTISSSGCSLQELCQFLINVAAFKVPKINQNIATDGRNGGDQ